MRAFRTITRTTVALAASLGVATASYANEEVQEWLDRMALAVESMSYRGTVVVWHDYRMDTLSITHASSDDGSRERILTLNGVPREVVRDRDSVISIMPDDRAVLVDRRLTERIFPVIPSDQVAQSGQYEFGLSGTDRVAGLDAQVVDIKPLDALRYGYRLWLEETTGMLLKSQLLRQEGELVEELMFTDIEIGAGITDDDLQPTLPAEGFRRIEVPSAEAPTVRRPADKKGLLSLVRVPEGFQLCAYNRQSGAGGKMSEHMVFTDGLASISVYVEPEQRPGDGIRGFAGMGALSAYGAARPGHRVTVVGDVPEITVQMIAQSLEGAE